MGRKGSGSGNNRGKPPTPEDVRRMADKIQIPMDKRARLDELMSQQHRDEAEWEEIKTMLRDYQLFTFDSVPETNRHHVFSEDGHLMAFTAIEKCNAYCYKLCKQGKCSPQVMIHSITFEELIDIADELRQPLFIDFKEDGLFLCYRCDTGRIEAIMAVQKGNLRSFLFSRINRKDKGKR